MAEGEKGTTTKTGATVPKGSGPFRSETATDPRMPDAKKEMSTKTNFLNLCTTRCYEAIHQYRITHSDKYLKQINWTYMKIQEQKADIKATLDELQEISPVEYETYIHVDKTVHDLKEFVTAAFKIIALEIRGAELKAKAEAELKAKAEAKLKAEAEAALKAEEAARLKAEEEAKLRAEAEIKAKAEEEARLKA